MDPSPRTVFMGSPAFAVSSLRALHAAGYDIVAVYTQPDRPGGRGQRERQSPVKQAALELGLEVRQPATFRSDEAFEELAALAPDLGVVAAYGLILPERVLDLAPDGFLNVHASLLPRHRGAAPVPGAILAGDAETGVTIMQIDPGLDTGPILAQRTTAISPDDTSRTLLDRLAVLGTELLLETIPGWVAGQITARPQDSSVANVCPQIRKEQGEIDWTADAAAIWRQVRAYNPWPGAYTSVGPERLTIHTAWPLAGECGDPGEVRNLDASQIAALGDRAKEAGFVVGTGSGALVPLLVQKAGRRLIDAASFVRGERGLIGSRLGRQPVARE